MQYRPVDGARWKPEPVVDIGWVDDAFRGHEHAFDATGGLKDRLYDSAFDAGPEYPGGIQDGFGFVLRSRTHPRYSYTDGGPVVRSFGEGDHPRAMDAAAFETPREGNGWFSGLTPAASSP